VLNVPGSYPSRISGLVAEHLPAEPSITLKPLLDELGCVSLQRNSDNEWFVTYPPLPSDEHEVLVASTLRLAMRSHLAPLGRHFYTDGISILDGLLRSHRWQQCLDSVDDAYCFAELLTRASCVIRENPEVLTAGYRMSLSASIHAVLEEWLPSSRSAESLHDASVMARGMFGDAWADIVLSASNVNPYDLPMFIRQTRPPFMSGLLRVDSDPSVLIYPLPDMGAP
jgi:hypothetical protein